MQNQQHHPPIVQNYILHRNILRPQTNQKQLIAQWAVITSYQKNMANQIKSTCSPQQGIPKKYNPHNCAKLDQQVITKDPVTYSQALRILNSKELPPNIIFTQKHQSHPQSFIKQPQLKQPQPLTSMKPPPQKKVEVKPKAKTQKPKKIKLRVNDLIDFHKPRDDNHCCNVFGIRCGNSCGPESTCGKRLGCQ